MVEAEIRRNVGESAAVLLMLRAALALGVGVVASWIVYAVARDSIPGNGYALVAFGVGFVAFVLIGSTDWYQRIRREMWERRFKGMRGG
jgi:hypothetical protein